MGTTHTGYGGLIGVGGYGGHGNKIKTKGK